MIMKLHTINEYINMNVIMGIWNQMGQEEREVVLDEIISSGELDENTKWKFSDKVAKFSWNDLNPIQQQFIANQISKE